MKPWEAVNKQKKIEEAREEASIEPLKFKFAEETLEKIETGQMDINARLNELDSNR